ncbi:MAG: hypothetical protein Q9Q40_14475, partial [Acidobacteriota bacterium]|nr:hypothetical protein [Acidobacteriota bacterium]
MNATSTVIHVRSLRYQERFGLAFAGQIELDWDRDSAFDSFETAYSYDDQPGGRGLLLRRRLPFPDGASISRQHPEYGLSYRHGALTGVAIYDAAGATTPWQEVVPDSAATPGIEYNVA